jgi:hypothetical protein
MEHLGGRYAEITSIDHHAAIADLGRRYSWIDTTKVGMFGGSGGGNATVNAMFRFPDFFKVGVAASGNHDDRSGGTWWIESWRGLLERDPNGGPDSYEKDANYRMAKNFKGKLLLAVGGMDYGVHPAHTMRVMSALIKANKHFDFFANPEGHHGPVGWAYWTKMEFDYFVHNLLGKEPPKYEFKFPKNPGADWLQNFIQSLQDYDEPFVKGPKWKAMTRVRIKNGRAHTPDHFFCVCHRSRAYCFPPLCDDPDAAAFPAGGVVFLITIGT